MNSRLPLTPRPHSTRQVHVNSHRATRNAIQTTPQLTLVKNSFQNGSHRSGRDGQNGPISHISKTTPHRYTTKSRGILRFSRTPAPSNTNIDLGNDAEQGHDELLGNSDSNNAFLGNGNGINNAFLVNNVPTNAFGSPLKQHQRYAGVNCYDIHDNDQSTDSYDIGLQSDILYDDDEKNDPLSPVHGNGINNNNGNITHNNNGNFINNNMNVNTLSLTTPHQRQRANSTTSLCPTTLSSPLSSGSGNGRGCGIVASTVNSSNAANVPTDKFLNNVSGTNLIKAKIISTPNKRTIISSNGSVSSLHSNDITTTLSSSSSHNSHHSYANSSFCCDNIVKTSPFNGPCSHSALATSPNGPNSTNNTVNGALSHNISESSSSSLNSPSLLSPQYSHYSHYSQYSSSSVMLQEQGERGIVHEENIPLEQLCTRVNTPRDAMFSLANITSLLQYIPPGSIVMFDIDDTLVKRTYEDSSLLTQNGLRMFQTYLCSTPCDTISIDAKNTLLRNLSQYLRSFSLAEPETALIVATLQERGCYVFGLTARHSSTSAMTSQMLRSLGIDIFKALPPSLPISAIEHATGAAVIDGVIYCNDVSKGVVFQRFMAQRWISFPVIHHCSEISCQNDSFCSKNGQVVTCTGHQNHSGAHHADGQCPDRYVWFIDDNYQQLESMANEWKSFAGKQLLLRQSLHPNSFQSIPCQGSLQLICCHYTHPTNYYARLEANPVAIPPGDFNKVVAVQISHFVKNNVLLTDSAALDIIAASPSWVHGGCSTPQPSASPIQSDAEGTQSPGALQNGTESSTVSPVA